MFYTKYRPQKFSEILRPNNAADALSTQVKTEKTVHAYLFIGPRGTGKTTTARILAKALNCSKLSKNGDPCGKCDACVAIQHGSFIDLIEIDAASNRGIDDIRELKSKIKLAPAHGKHKVYIIDEVHMLTKEAFNALLKTLEEPPRGVTFILCTTESNKVPDTIKSRCQVYNFKRASIKQLVEKLELIVGQEKAEIPKESLQKIASASLGGYRDAETLLQQVLEGELSVDSFSSLESCEGYIQFIDHLWRKDANGAVKMIAEAFAEGVDLYIWVGELLRYLRDLLFIKSGVDDSLITVTGEVAASIKKLAQEIELRWIVPVLDEFLEAQPKIKDAFISQLPIEISIYKICSGASGAAKAFDMPLGGGFSGGDKVRGGNGGSRGARGSGGGQGATRPPKGGSGELRKGKDDGSTKTPTTKSENNPGALKVAALEASTAVASSVEVLAEVILETVVPDPLISSEIDSSEPASVASSVPASVSVDTEGRDTAQDAPQELPDISHAPAISITLEEIVADWPNFLKELRAENPSLISIMKHGKPLRVEGGKLVVEVCYTFHKDRLETPKNKKAVENALDAIYSCKLSLRCELNKERAKKLSAGTAHVLSDYNIVNPADGKVTVDKDALIDAFDGGLPLV
jgi:DNA polymerase III subunit gamma/tau